MKKQFELPKEFAEKWLKALRSEDYEQGKSSLYTEHSRDYCCLGVACRITGMEEDVIEGIGTIYDLVSDGVDVPEKIPEILVEGGGWIIDNDKLNFTGLLITLNDHELNVKEAELLEKKGLVFHKKANNDSGNLEYNFKDIAQFIEDNCEFV